MDIALAKVDLPADARPHDPEALKQLTFDMKKQGQLQEIIVEKKQGRFLVIAGVGRTLAARKLGWTKIRADIKQNVSEFDRARITFAENEDREEVDAFYQAYQLTKMWKLRGGSQQALARELGVSDALLSAYLTIAKLPDSIKTTFRRLKVGQLTQIARLSREKSKIALAEKCRQEDLSVRQLKAIVDRKLTKDRPSAKAPSQSERKPKDPLEAFWPELSYKEDISSAGLWAVAYGSCTGFAGGKLPGDGWRFWVSNGYGDTPKEQLGKWFKEMAEAFGETPREKKIASPRVEAVRAAANAREREETESFARALMTGEAKIRLPKTPAEQAELEALAAQGPGAVYAWIYGPESIFTKQVQPMTWEQMDVKDPVQGCRDLLKTIGS